MAAKGENNSVPIQITHFQVEITVYKRYLNIYGGAKENKQLSHEFIVVM